MATPTYIGSGSATAAASTSKAVTYTSTVGNALLLAIELHDGTQSVSGVTDSAGNNGFGNPVNQWEFITGNTFNGHRTELWVCRAAASVTSVTVSVASAQDITIQIAEYSNVTGFSVYGNYQVNVSQNTPLDGSGNNTKALNQSTHINLTVEQPPTNASTVMVAFFGLLISALPGDVQTFVGATAGTLRATVGASSPNPNLCVVDNGTVGSDGNLQCGVNLTNFIMGADPNDYDYLGTSSLQTVYVVLTGGLVLGHEPGFSDVSDYNFAAGQLARGLDLIKVAENASFGMVRFEVFYGEYKNGDTVNMPISPVDGYNYTRTELMYIWCIRSTVNPSSGWSSAQEALWYGNWKVDQTTGAVSCEEWYTWIHAAKPAVQSQDGVLGVFTIAQRQLANLTMKASPYYVDLPDSSFALDTAYRQDILQTMNRNAKFSVVGLECIYMGEFDNGDTVPQPVSPVDGYVYGYAQCAMVPCWRWTTTGDTYTQPSDASEFWQNLTVSIAGGAVTTDETVWNPTNGVTSTGGNGRVAVFALCNRNIKLVDTLSGTTTTSTISSGLDTGWNQNLTGDVLLVNYTKAAGTPPPSIRVDFVASDLTTVLATYTVFLNRPVFLFAPSGAFDLKVEASVGWGSITITTELYTTATLIFKSLANQFKELTDINLLFGNYLPFPIMKQLNDNIREAIATPEIFGPTNYSDGGTVSLPTSPIDGYVYSRSELFYIWSQPAFGSTSSVRLIVGEGWVDISTGAVHVNTWELPHGGVGTAYHDGTLAVTVVAVRSGTGRSTGASNSTFNTGTPTGDQGNTQVTNEVPAGAINGVNKVYTLANPPYPTTSLVVYIDGARTTAFTLGGGTTLTMTNAPTVSLIVDYTY